MGKKRKKQASGGGDIPEWVVTFGDMMSLLLCFFILLQMFSEPKRDSEYQRVITAVKEAFGYEGGIGVMPVEDLPLKSMIEVLETMALKSEGDVAKVSAAQDPGIDGPKARVTRVRDGLVFTIGGQSSFDPLSAELKPAVREQILQLAPMLRGRKNKIEVIGHAAAAYLPEGGPWKDLDELAFARAKAAMEVLREAGVEDVVFRLTAAGTREPIRPRAASAAEAAENRRVEIIMTEVTVDDLNGESSLGDEREARGG